MRANLSRPFSMTGLFTLLLASASPAFGWIYDVETGTLGTALSVVTDGDGNAIAGGRFPLLADDDGFFVVELDGASGDERWRFRIGRNGEAQDVALDANDDVIAAGSIFSIGGTRDDFTVIKLSGDTGAELWRTVIDGGDQDSDGAMAVAIDSAGDVVAAGTISPANNDFAVIKLDGDDGTEMWRYVIAGSGTNAHDIATEVAIDGNDDVVAAGTLRNSDDDWVVVKLAGADGDELWREDLDGTKATSDDILDSLALDSAGNAIVSGSLDNSASRDFSVIKYDAASGAESWRREIATGHANAVAVDDVDDVYVAGSNAGSDVFKLAGSDGTESWRASVESGYGVTSVDSIVLDGADGVFVGGRIQNPFGGTAGDMVVAKLDSADGTFQWRQMIDGQKTINDDVQALALNGDGDVAVAGSFGENPQRFAVVELDGEKGSFGTVRGSKIAVGDPSVPTRRTLSFLLKDEFIQSPAGNTLSDPRTVGVTVQLLNPTTLEEATFFLPPGPGWQALGQTPGVKGFRYKAPPGNGPCTYFKITPGKDIKVSCKAKFGSLPFTLDEASQGSLAVSVRFTDLAPQCAIFGGTVSRDQPGQFKAKNSPAEVDCP